MACTTTYDIEFCRGEQFLLPVTIQDVDSNDVETDVLFSLYDVSGIIYDVTNTETFITFDGDNLPIASNILTITLTPTETTTFVSANKYTYYINLTLKTDATSIDNYLKGEVDVGELYA